MRFKLVFMIVLLIFATVFIGGLVFPKDSVVNISIEGVKYTKEIPKTIEESHSMIYELADIINRLDKSYTKTDKVVSDSSKDLAKSIDNIEKSTEVLEKTKEDNKLKSVDIIDSYKPVNLRALFLSSYMNSINNYTVNLNYLTSFRRVVFVFGGGLCIIKEQKLKYSPSIGLGLGFNF